MPKIRLKPTLKPCDEQSAISIVQGQAELNKTIVESNKRIRILARVADFLWKYDEPTARKYFTEAYNLARERFKEKGFEAKKDGFFINEQSDFRIWVLEQIAKKDGKWGEKIAAELTKDLEAEAKELQSDLNKDYFNLRQILEAAQTIFKTNQTAGLNTARIAFRLSFKGSVWSNFLFRLAETNQTAADNFYAELIARFANESMTEILYLYSYPFGQIRGIGLNKNSVFNNVPQSFVTNPNLQKLFLNTILHRAADIVATANQTSEQNVRGNPALQGQVALQELETIVEPLHPEFLARIQSMKTQLLAFITQKDREFLAEQQKRETNSQLTFAEKIKKLEEIANANELDVAIINLVFGSLNEDELAQIEPWLIKISDSEVAEPTVQFFYHRRAEVATKDKRFDDARKYADKVSELELRAVLYLGIADEKLKNESATTDADEILSELEKLVLKADNSVAKVRVLLGIAFLYEKFNAFRAVDVLGNAVKTANKLENENIFSASTIRKIEKKGKYGYYAVYSMPGFDLENTFNRLSRKNFDAALAEARSLTDKYWQTLAVIATVKDCVTNTEEEPKKQTKPKNKGKN